jgi:hypothetical protein
LKSSEPMTGRTVWLETSRSAQAAEQGPVNVSEFGSPGVDRRIVVLLSSGDLRVGLWRSECRKRTSERLPGRVPHVLANAAAFPDRFCREAFALEGEVLPAPCNCQRQDPFDG